jgi:hypothetical protein
MRYTIDADQVRQTVDVDGEEVGPPGPSTISVGIPPLPWKQGGTTHEFISGLIGIFAYLNPHITFIIKDGPKVKSLPLDAQAAPVYRPPSESGPASWFTADEFAERLAADIRARPTMSLASWMMEFSGTRASACAAVTVGGRPSSEMVVDGLAGDLKRSAASIRSVCIVHGSKIDDPKFQVIGKDRINDMLIAMGGDSGTPVEYHWKRGTFVRGESVVPYLVEVGLLQLPDGSRQAPTPILAMNRTALYGSPTFDNLKWREKVRGQWHGLEGDLGAILRAYEIDHGKTPSAVVVHVVCPSPGYKGYGKQDFDTSWLGEPLSECMEAVTKEVRRQRAGEARRRNAKDGPRETIRDTLFAVLPAAYDDFSEGGRLPILIRNLYYAVRGVWENHHPDKLQYQTFCVYVDEYERMIGRPLCLRDPRGTLLEPHSGRTLRLGTDEVSKYNPKRWEGHTVIFIEKESFAHVLRDYGIMKRWDAIVIGSKGFAVESCREVLQKYRRLLGGVVKIIALHDADPAGYMIGYDLANNLPRFGENTDVQVIDVGLTVADGERMNLLTEPFELKRANWSMINNMRRHLIREPDGRRRPLMEPEAWDAFMPSMFRGSEFPAWAENAKGRRIELNAMRPRLFIQWLEGHLERNGCRKVRPPDEVVNETMKGALENAVRGEVGKMLMRIMGQSIVDELLAEIGVPVYDLDAALVRKPEQHWEYLVKRAAETGVDLGAAVERVAKRRELTPVER